MSDSFIFSFVRMNPPTPGHLQIIKALIDKAIELNSEKVYIITSNSMDGKNPLPCSESTIPKPKTKPDGPIMGELLSHHGLVYKSSILEEMITNFKQRLIEAESPEGAAELVETPDPKRLKPEAELSEGVAELVETSDLKRLKPETEKFGGNRRQQLADLKIIVLCSFGSPFAFIHSIIQKDFLEKGIPKINMVFIVGRDRADFLDTIVDTFKTHDYISSIDGDILEREGMEELKSSGLCGKTVSEINPCAYSASFIRGLVENQQRDVFEQIYTPFLSPENIDKLYETIQLGIRMKVPTSKKVSTEEIPQSAYFDGKRLPWKNLSAGKRKKNRKYKKSKRKTRRMRF